MTFLLPYFPSGHEAGYSCLVQIHCLPCSVPHGLTSMNDLPWAPWPYIFWLGSDEGGLWKDTGRGDSVSSPPSWLILYQQLRTQHRQLPTHCAPFSLSSSSPRPAVLASHCYRCLGASLCFVFLQSCLHLWKELLRGNHLNQFCFLLRRNFFSKFKQVVELPFHDEMGTIVSSTMLEYGPSINVGYLNK